MQVCTLQKEIGYISSEMYLGIKRYYISLKLLWTISKSVLNAEDHKLTLKNHKFADLFRSSTEIIRFMMHKKERKYID